MFVDEITIHARAGKGGDGSVLWRHEKGKEFSGPSGGNGGSGGNIYAVAVKDLGLLASYRSVKEFSADNGGRGMRNSKHGENGKSLEIKLPVGSTITNLKTKKKVKLDKEEQKETVLFGGQGGLGNEYFKSSTNRSPKEFTYGKQGEEADLLIELELIADVGLIGLPNAGKSSLLNALTNAKAKVGEFAFTTLEPNLGSFHGFMIADIPGLIEGASKGKGLGDKFLRHIRRTKVLAHCISVENDNLTNAYKTVRAELGMYDKELQDKQEIILVTKVDLVSSPALKEMLEELYMQGKKIIEVSVIDDVRLGHLIKELSKTLSALNKEEMS